MSEKITFEILAERVSIETATDIETVKSYLHTLFDTIKEENEKNNWVKIRNFGSFHPVYNKEKAGVNPQTGEKMMIPAHYHVHFTPSKKLSELVNTTHCDLQSFEAMQESEKTKKADKKPQFFLALLAAILAIGILAYFIFSQKESTPLKQTVQEKIKIETVEKESSEQEKIVEKRIIPAEAKEEIVTYIVKKGDTLSDISKKKYGVAYFWPLIYSLNKEEILDQDMIYPGMRLKMPDAIDMENPKEIKLMVEAFKDACNNYKRVGKIQSAYWILYVGHKRLDNTNFNEFVNRFEEKNPTQHSLEGKDKSKKNEAQE